MADGRKNMLLRYLASITFGALFGVLLIQPVNDMVIFHMYESHDGSLTPWQFIYHNLLKSLSGQTNTKTLYYTVVGGVLGLLLGLVFRFIRSKLDTIDSLNQELGKDLALLLSQGEGPRLEFKSSFRWDLRQNQANKALEVVIIKTLAGFLNGDGGTLLIGVSDEGAITGLKADYTLLKKSDADGFEQAVITAVSTNLGADLCQNLHIVFHQIEGEDICRIIIKPAPRPVYLVREGGPRLYLRTGGGTRDMNIQEATAYIKGRWG
ncbi:MAG: ATP-binding protein [Gammaproteobacteria bacterium]|nr:ATP-binding protein [Gammaproteobacteria bacterium]MBQ0839547.1 ATP-binding protein [Gammaproteobacteria bacterium]